VTIETRADPLPLWGGVECTVARVGDRWRDQSVETGHDARIDDIDRIAALGIQTVRYPILWERICPERPDRFDFGRTDARLDRLRARGMTVIGGLLHHGSGPHYTSLVDPDFPARFADYAAAIAARYPWIEWWTPVNEPLTTARFSGLYGHWYPHGGDFATFARALVNQCLGIDGAMAAIRRANPAAKLLQTEDLGRCFATAPLAYQADYENERRWLSFDLLAGRVTRAHRFYQPLLDAGIGADDLSRLADGPARPDMLGINHYPTSERFLDHRIGLYPDDPVGGNGRDDYVDAEAVRVAALRDRLGLATRLGEAWARYGIPLAVTEVHHGCTREEQLRWFVQLWNEAHQARDAGIDVRGVTLWSLFGAVDWRSLLTREDGATDVGAFDPRSTPPRPTLIGRAARALATTGRFDHPALAVPGWWRRAAGLYRWQEAADVAHPARPLLITGATGTLGQAMARLCAHRGLACRLTSRAELDLDDQRSIDAMVERERPWAVVNTAGHVRVAEAENDADACMAANATGAARLARACARAGIPMVAFSSDLVFDGAAGPYDEDSATCPRTVYGMSKAAMEDAVLAASPDHLVIRTSAFFGPWDRHNFAWAVLDALGRGRRFEADAGTIVSPTFVPDLVHATLDLLLDGERGIWHLANEGAVSWHGFARTLAEGAGYDPGCVRAIRTGAPCNTALVSARGRIMRPLDRAMGDFLNDMAATLALPPALAAE
jgi:dTDP-4-dehydrorhamnose reductase